jgi:hypothetical protein
MINLHINGNVHSVEATEDTPLLWILRDILGLTGTKFGCGIAQCGACTVRSLYWSLPFNSLEAAASRREFLKVSVAAGGALLLGFALPRAYPAEQLGSAAVPFAPDAFICIDRNGTVTLIMCQVEMGHGIYTSISQILADELDVDFKHLVVEAAPPNDALYANPALHFQVTGGSTSIRVS